DFCHRLSVQKMSFSASCTTRGSPALTTFPNEDELKFVSTAPGRPKNGVFVKLKNSVRNCSRICSRNRKFLKTDTSKLTSPGSRMQRTPALPKKLPAAISAVVGIANAPGLIHWCGWRADLVGSPTALGRLLVAVFPSEELSPGVIGNPPWN